MPPKALQVVCLWDNYCGWMPTVRLYNAIHPPIVFLGLGNGTYSQFSKGVGSPLQKTHFEGIDADVLLIPIHARTVIHNEALDTLRWLFTRPIPIVLRIEPAEVEPTLDEHGRDTTDPDTLYSNLGMWQMLWGTARPDTYVLRADYQFDSEFNELLNILATREKRPITEQMSLFDRLY